MPVDWSTNSPPSITDTVTSIGSPGATSPIRKPMTGPTLAVVTPSLPGSIVVRQKAEGAPSAQQIQQLTAEQFKGARILLERDGFALVEALKGQPPTAAH